MTMQCSGFGCRPIDHYGESIFAHVPGCPAVAEHIDSLDVVENHCPECGEYEAECLCSELDAHDALAEAARALLAAFGGNTPDYLRSEAEALEAALARVNGGRSDG